MKKTHIIAIAVIAICAAIIMTTAGDASSYVTFHEAQAMATAGQDKMIHVVGQLKKDEQGHIVGLNPSPDKLSVSFVMVDQDGQEQQVYYNEPMPSDLVRSEQTVVIGSYHKDLFVADQILLKCPSKYQEEEIG